MKGHEDGPFTLRFSRPLPLTLVEIFGAEAFSLPEGGPWSPFTGTLTSHLRSGLDEESNIAATDATGSNRTSTNAPLVPVKRTYWHSLSP